MYISLGMKRTWVGYDVGCTMGSTLGHGAWQIDRPSNGSMWNSYSFQTVGQWMGYSFTDLGAEGCCCSLNALFVPDFVFGLHRCLDTGLTTQNHVVFNSIFAVPGQFRRVPCILVQYISENAICDHIFLLWLKFSGLLTATGSTMERCPLQYDHLDQFYFLICGNQKFFPPYNDDARLKIWYFGASNINFMQHKL